MSLPLLLCGLAGCPYLFGAPSLPEPVVPDTDSDSDSAGDTDLPPDPTPVLTGVDLRLVSDLEVRFAVHDADGDLEQGELDLTADGETTTYALSTGLDVWNPDGISSLSLPVACEGLTISALSVSVRDLAGLQSDPWNGSVDIGGSGSFVHEGWEDWEVLGEVKREHIVCGRVKGTFNALHLDWTAPETRRVTLTLAWDHPLVEMDLAWWICEGGPSDPCDTTEVLRVGFGPSPVVHEQDVEAGVHYVAVVFVTEGEEKVDYTLTWR